MLCKKFNFLVYLVIFWACFIITTTATAEKVTKSVTDASVKPALPDAKTDPTLKPKKEKTYTKHQTTVKKKSNNKSNKLTKTKWQVKPKKNEYRKRGW